MEEIVEEEQLLDVRWDFPICFRVWKAQGQPEIGMVALIVLNWKCGQVHWCWVKKFGFEIGGSSETFLDAFLQSGLDILKLSNTQISAQAICVSEGNDIQ